MEGGGKARVQVSHVKLEIPSRHAAVQHVGVHVHTHTYVHLYVHTYICQTHEQERERGWKRKKRVDGGSRH